MAEAGVFLAVVVFADAFMGEALAAGVIFLAAFTGEIDFDLALTGSAIGAALDDLLGSAITAAFLTEAAFLTGDDTFIGETVRWLALGDACFFTGEAGFFSGE